MKGYIAFMLVLAALFAAPAAFAKTQTLSPDDSLAVVRLVQDRLKVPDLDASMVARAPYAIAYWKASNEHGAGSALLKKTSGNWAILAMSTSLLNDEATLERDGVPPAQAKLLVEDLSE